MLTSVHWIYLAIVLVVILTMGFRRDTVLPCALGLFIVGYAFTGNFVKAIQVMYNALVAAGSEFLGIIVIISLVVAMSKALTDVGADYLIMRPAARLMVNADVAYWVLGITMAVVSWLVWPSPAVALIGAIMLPVAIKAGLPAIGAAMAMNLFGHGIGLSSDWVIQGAPSISAKSAGLASAADVLVPGFPLFVTMGLVTTVTAYIMLKKDMKKNIQELHDLHIGKQEPPAERKYYGPLAYTIAILVPLFFAVDVYLMLALNLKGGDATALIGGTALLVMCIIAIAQHKLDALEAVTDYVRDGFMFGIKIFAPVIVIGAFFFLGAESTAKAVLGPNATGFMTDIAQALAKNIPLSKFPVAIMEMAVGIIVGMDGSGFAPLPLTGSLAGSFGQAINANIGVLATLGQIAGVWTGGGTIIPWGLIPVAAICGVDPLELARRNFIPVIIGFVATLIVGVLIM
ncbi:MAG: hypothetical protein JG781_2128 [Peptococcaceae bacterium]|jgi:hypothetical protein|nr:hypothetical protein [Peptococcaceae bacterium]